MKIIKVVVFVFFFHVSLLSILFFQPGCQTIENCSPCVPSNDCNICPVEIVECPVWEEVIPQEIACRNVRFQPTRPIRNNLNELESVQKTFEDTSSQKIIEKSGSNYNVQAGDSLWIIAKRNGITVSDLAEANGISRDTILKIGQKLFIPGKKGAAGGVSIALEGTSYTIVKGDTLSEIAARFHVSVEDIKRVNHMNDNVIYAGKQIVIPGANSKNIGVAIKNTQDTFKEKLELNEGFYVVKKGDFLSDIAKRFGVSVNDLMKWNNIADARKLRIGQKLIMKNSLIPETTILTSVEMPEDKVDEMDMFISEINEEEDYNNLDLFEDDSLFDTSEEIPVIAITEE